MTVNSVSSVGAVATTDPSATLNKTRADFQALAAALQANDLASAQKAFAQLEKDNPRLAKALSSDSSSSDNSRLGNLKDLAGALQSGDLSGAQQAFAKIQQAVQVGASQHHHHHHHAAAATTSAADGIEGLDASGNPISVGSTLNTSA